MGHVDVSLKTESFCLLSQLTRPPVSDNAIQRQHSLHPQNLRTLSLIFRRTFAPRIRPKPPPPPPRRRPPARPRGRGSAAPRCRRRRRPARQQPEGSERPRRKPNLGLLAVSVKQKLSSSLFFGISNLFSLFSNQLR